MVPRRAPVRLLAILLLFLGTLLVATAAQADKLVFKDGKTLSGRVIQRGPNSITFATTENGRPVVRRYALSKIRKVVPELESEDDPFAKPDSEDEEGPAAGAGDVARRVVLLIDRSGSMAFGGRLEKARQAASALMRTFPEKVRLLVYAFDDKVEPMQRSYRNVIEANTALFENCLRRITINRTGRTDFERAIKSTLRVEPDDIHIFTDGIDRSQPGLNLKTLQATLLRITGKKIKINTHLIQSGKVPYMGGEPSASVRGFFESLAKETGGACRLLTKEGVARAEELGVELLMIDGKTAVKTLSLGKRYRVVVRVKGAKAENSCDEYLAGLPLLARSVDSQGRDVVRRKDLELIRRGGKIETVDEVKIVASSNPYRGSRGYIAAVPGGRVALFFDSLGRWVRVTFPVAPAE